MHVRGYSTDAQRVCFGVGRYEELLLCPRRAEWLIILGIYNCIEEVSVRTKTPPRTVSLHLDPEDETKPLLDHWVLCIHLKGGKKYAVDIAGAQFGYHNSVLLWEQFVKERVDGMIIDRNRDSKREER